MLTLWHMLHGQRIVAPIVTVRVTVLDMILLAGEGKGLLAPSNFQIYTFGYVSAAERQLLGV